MVLLEVQLEILLEEVLLVVPLPLVLLCALSAAEAKGSFSSTCAVAFLPVTAVTMRKRRTIKVTQSVAI